MAASVYHSLVTIVIVGYVNNTVRVDQKFFAGKIFCRLDFRLILFSSLLYMCEKLTLIIRRRKYFACLIFIVEGD